MISPPVTRLAKSEADKPPKVGFASPSPTNLSTDLPELVAGIIFKAIPFTVDGALMTGGAIPLVPKIIENDGSSTSEPGALRGEFACMNTSASRKCDCRSDCCPERELAQEEVKAEGEEITIVDEKKPTANAISEEVVALSIY